jgi:hypothetical protein
MSVRGVAHLFVRSLSVEESYQAAADNGSHEGFVVGIQHCLN